LTGLGEASAELSQVDFDIGDSQAEDIEPTSVMTGRRRGPEGPTMTEVGTKLDLARAYVDMGDPDGARSILNEVLEEGDSAQRQEARRLLDDLTD
jgi:pilus assembly protein FimV